MQSLSAHVVVDATVVVGATIGGVSVVVGAIGVVGVLVVGIFVGVDSIDALESELVVDEFEKYSNTNTIATINSTTAMTIMPPMMIFFLHPLRVSVHWILISISVESIFNYYFFVIRNANRHNKGYCICIARFFAKNKKRFQTKNSSDA